MCDDQTKLSKLDKAAAGIESSPSSDDKVTAITETCPETLPFHIGILLRVTQYLINSRVMALRVGTTWNESFDKADDFHASEVNALKEADCAQALPEPPDPVKVYPIGAERGTANKFTGVLTTKSTLMQLGSALGYETATDFDHAFNDYLGTALALHVCRTRTFHPIGEDQFKWGKIERVEESRPTEKCALKVYCYLKVRIDETEGIFPISQGLISSSPITKEKYDQLKSVTDDHFKSGECKSMPLIPGVNQIHVLINSSGGLFSIEEAHCDGDRIFPS